MVSTTLLAAVLAVSGSSDVTLLQFTADWCGACQTVKPTVQRLSTAGFPIRIVNVDRERELVSQYRVTSVPCFVLVSGGREIDRVVEAASYARLVQMFERAGVSPTQIDTGIVLGQSPEPARSGPAGLPRPLASLARGFGRRREPEEQLVQIEAGSPAPQATTSIPSPSGIGPRGLSDPQSNFPSKPASNFAPASNLAPASSIAAATNIAPASNSAPARSSASLHDAAVRATVRLRIDDLSGHSVGTGTIIDINQGEALVVTCGHVFRDSSGKGRIAVDLFANQQPQTVNGTLIGYDLERDLGFVAIPVSGNMVAAPVAPAGFEFRREQPVFSVGCDRGSDPSVRVSKITGIDRYVGAPNIEIAGEPVSGRSGGGLFSEDGQLIGVCNAADPKDNEGIFASLPAIHWELDRIGQRRIYAARETQVAQASTPAANRNFSESQALAATPPSRPISANPVPTTSAPSAITTGDDTEVICIVRSRANPQGMEQLVVLDRPSQDFMDRLAQESRGRPFPGVTQQSGSRNSATPAFADRDLNRLTPPGQTQVIRAQDQK